MVTLKLRKGVRLTQCPTDMKILLEGAVNFEMKVLDSCPALALRVSANGGLSFRISGPQFPLGRVWRRGSLRAHPSFPTAEGGRMHSA